MILLESFVHTDIAKAVGSDRQLTLGRRGDCSCPFRRARNAAVIECPLPGGFDCARGCGGGIRHYFRAHGAATLDRFESDRSQLSACSGTRRRYGEGAARRARRQPPPVVDTVLVCWRAGFLSADARELGYRQAVDADRRLRGRFLLAADDDTAASSPVDRETRQLLESCLTDVPVVLGYLRPVVLMPAGALLGLPVEQIEAILLHELAHVRRADYVVNLLQTFVESLFFYHPGVWWISRVIRAERENCCDDLVVETQGDAGQYAAALAAFEEYRYGQTALAATGGNLMKRMERILGRHEQPRAGFAPVFSAAMILISGALLVTAWQSPGSGSGMSAAYTDWLNHDVVYIISAQERAAFEKLDTDVGEG